jgi:hypothetical protein
LFCAHPRYPIQIIHNAPLLRLSHAARKYGPAHAIVAVNLQEAACIQAGRDSFISSTFFYADALSLYPA